MSSLAKVLPEEINRVRRLQDECKSLRGRSSTMIEIPIAIMEMAITEGIVSLASGDVVRMLRAFHALQGFTE